MQGIFSHAVIAGGIVGYGLVICFLLLKAPDLAIVQIVVETITLIIMVAVVLDSSRDEPFSKPDLTGVHLHAVYQLFLLMIGLFYFFEDISDKSLDEFGNRFPQNGKGLTLKGQQKKQAVPTLLQVLFLISEGMTHLVRQQYL